MKFLEAPNPEQKFLAHEVVQTSAMDCGPATLKSVLEGFGIPVSYGRLREACQTDVDGTSIDTIEDIAVQLGLRAEQIMIPVDHILLPEAQALPAIIVVQRPNGMTHFLIVWGRIGKFVQVMDPATGRRWPTWEAFQREIYVHTFPVPAATWRDWAGSEGMLAPLKHRMEHLQLEEKDVNRLIADALEDPQWRSIAALDAATRMVAAIVRAKGIPKGSQASQLLRQFYERNKSASRSESGEAVLPGRNAGIPGNGLKIPGIYWSAQPDQEQKEGDPESSEARRLLLRGAVLVRFMGVRESAAEDVDEIIEERDMPAPLPKDLEAALKEPAYQPEREVWKSLKEDGLLTPAILVLAILSASITLIIEILLFQGILQIGGSLGMTSQRIWAAMILMLFMVLPLLLEIPIASTVLRMGRRLESRLRIKLLEKIPRLGDRYFRSRLASDMTHRAYDLRQLRMLPNLGVSLLRIGFQLILTTLAVIWLDPISAPLAIVGTALFFALSFAARPILEERDLRFRTQTGALSSFYLDGLLGLVPIKSHGAEKAYRRQHETQLYEWVRTGREYYKISTFVQSFGTLLYSTFAVLIIMNYISKGGEPNEILLLFYWTLSLPTLGQSLAEMVQQYPMQRNRVNRLLEPLGAPDEEEALTSGIISSEGREAPAGTKGEMVAFEMRDVWVRIGGHVILKDIKLDVQPGEHIAIIGPSGAGKSSLIGLLLGWNRPAQGQILVNGVVLDGKRILTLRRETAWVDPAVQLWNRSLYENLKYGQDYVASSSVANTLDVADIYEVLERLPDGMKTVLGEGGGLVSGGEGQRVRLGRAVLRSGIRLVLLDEPFRGLDREKRRNLLSNARQHWAGATLLCITHDVSETRSFPRVLVMDDGMIVEDGAPASLARQKGSRYATMLSADRDVHKSLWEGVGWRRWVLEKGRLMEQGRTLEDDTAGG